MDFRDRQVVVTGGTGALGTAVVGALLEAGAICHVPYLDEKKLGRFPYRDHRGMKLVGGCDVADEADAARLFDGIDALWASLHIAGASGMSPLAETDIAVCRAQVRKAPVAVLQCTSAYPCPPERVGLNLISFYRDRYGCGVGLSDHSGTIYAGLAAAALDIDILEVHITMSRGMFGPDVPASVTMEELRQLVDGIRFVERIRAHPVDKDAIARDMAPLRGIFTKSLVASMPLAAGTVLAERHLAMKKPGTGIPAGQLSDILGRRLRRSLEADEQLRLDDLEQ